MATTLVDKGSSASSGIALIGDEKKFISLVVNNDNLIVIYRKDKLNKILFKEFLPNKAKVLQLRVSVEDNTKAQFSYSIDG